MVLGARFGLIDLSLHVSWSGLPYQLSQNRREFNDTLHQGSTTAFELNPSLVEPVEHPDARHRVPHSLRFEQSFPGFTRDGLGTNGMAENCGEGVRDVVGRDSTRAL